MFIQLTLMSESKPFHIRHDGFSDQNISDGSKELSYDTVTLNQFNHTSSWHISFMSQVLFSVVLFLYVFCKKKNKTFRPKLTVIML